MKAELPIVRPLVLPADGAPLEWREGPDLPAVTVVMLAGVIGAWLGTQSLATGASGEAFTVAMVFVVLGGLLTVAAVSELVRLEQVVVSDGEVCAYRRDLLGRRRWCEPLAAFSGVAVEDRGRRLFVRNQGLPATGRRGPVSEFVLVLRHRTNPQRHLELFRAQPSLSVLRDMHTVRAGKGGADVAECERVARGYGDALRTLCRRLDLPALVAGPDGEPAPAAPERLDLWLRPADDAS